MLKDKGLLKNKQCIYLNLLQAQVYLKPKFPVPETAR